MKHIRRLIILACMAVPMAGAQQISASAMAQGASSRKADVVTVTLDLENVSLATALDEIARQSGARIWYSRVRVAGRVTVKRTNITVADALSQVLHNTKLEGRRTPDGSWTVSERIAGGVSHVAQGVIAGKVMDAKNGKGVAGANVSIGIDNRGVMTDEDGSYHLAGVAVGVHTVTVRLVGYAKQTRSVTVGDGITVTVDFKLEPSASVLNDVIVTGTIISTELKAVPNAITVITAKQIEERGITRIDQLFRGDIPGLFSLNLGANALLDEVTMFSRGATAITNPTGIASAGTGNGTNPIKTYVDGIELASPKYLSQIDPSSIERIEILTGPQASTIYGANAINGVMQIFTKRGSTSRPQLSLSLSSGVAQNNFSSHLAPSYVADANVSSVEGRVSYNVGGSWDYVGSWTPAKQTQRLGYNGGGRMERAKLTVDVSARRGLTQNKQNGIVTQGSTNLRATGVWTFTSSANNGLLPIPMIQTLLGQTLGFSLGYRPFSWWSHDMGLGSDVSMTEATSTAPILSNQSDTLLSVNPVATSRTSEHYTTTMQLPLSSLARLNLTMGGDHFRTKGSSLTASPLFLVGSFSCPFDGACLRTKPSKNSGAFVQGQFSIKDALFFTYGVRADWNPNFGDKAKVKPGRYGVSFARDIETPLGPVSTKLRGSYGRSIRPPAEGQKLAQTINTGSLPPIFGVFDFIFANPYLGPEHQQGGEGGIELYLGSRASLVVTRYNQTVDNLISLVGSQSAPDGPGLDSVRSLTPQPTTQTLCSSSFRDADGYCYKYQKQYLNVGSIRNQGWELTSSINLGPLTTRGTYSWTKSRVLGITPKYRAILTGLTVGGSAFQSGRAFNFIPEHTWALGLTYVLSASSLALSINGIGIRYNSFDALLAAANSSSRLTSSRPNMSLSATNYRAIGSGYTTADLNATHRFSPRIDATLQVSNLTNYYQNDLNVSYATLGRQTKAGVRLRW